MKQTGVIVIFLLFFCFIASAQNDETIPKRITEPYDKFGRLTSNDLKARIDVFYTELQPDPKAEGVIVIDFNKKDKRKSKIAWLKAFNQAFEFRKMDKTRFTFVISEGSSEQTTLWILFNGGNKIEESSEKNKWTIKGENLRQAINKIFKN
jgi:hypothetical protein